MQPLRTTGKVRKDKNLDSSISVTGKAWTSYDGER